jgi:hypothetical protein
MYEFASRGIPVINLLNIRKLAAENGLPYDPAPLPRAGEGGVYSVLSYRLDLLIATLLVPLGILAAGLAAESVKGRRGQRP